MLKKILKLLKPDEWQNSYTSDFVNNAAGLNFKLVLPLLHTNYIMIILRKGRLVWENGIATTPATAGTNSFLQRMNAICIWLIVPASSILIPTFCGFTHPSSTAVGLLLPQYILFTAVGLVIYKGNMFFLHSIRLHYKGSSMPHLQIVLMYFLVNIVYSGIVSLATLSAWSSFVNQTEPFAKPVITTVLVILICVLFINNLYEIFYLQAAKKASEDKMMLLEEAKTQAELQALSSEIDPHFMYNALTSLSYLLQQNPTEADNYNAMLAAQYRYVLKNKCRHLVPLSQELDFCRQYFSVQQLRFGQSALFQVLHGGLALDTLHVPPLSVQTLLENALKHNNFSDTKPLVIQVLVSAGHVRVKNRIQPQPYAIKGTGTGLCNLNKRILLLAKQPLQIIKDNDEFVVKLPVVSQ